MTLEWNIVRLDLKKFQLYTVNRRHTLDSNIQIESKRMERVCKQQKKFGVIVLMSDKIDLKTNNRKCF